MPKRSELSSDVPESDAAKSARQDKAPPAGGSVGDRQAQYGTSAQGWQEPLPGSEERGDFGAGGEAFASSKGQGRYGGEHSPGYDHGTVDQPEHSAWKPVGQKQDNAEVAQVDGKRGAEAEDEDRPTGAVRLGGHSRVSRNVGKMPRLNDHKLVDE
jgi:hypothetical protein